MSAVGFDLFAQMLGAAVNATREGDLKAAEGLPPALSDITVNLPGRTYLSEEYVPESRLSGCCGIARSQALQPSAP